MRRSDRWTFCHARHGKNGFTLIEVLIVIAIISIATTGSILMVINWLPNYRLKMASRDIISNFQKARFTAIQRNVLISISFVRNGDGDIIGYSIYADPNLNRARDADEPEIDRVEWASRYKGDIPADQVIVNFTKNANDERTISFDGRGVPRNVGGGFGAGTITLVNTRGKSQQVVISAAGSMRIAS